MITIFGDFCQFAAKKLAFFSKNHRHDHMFAKSSTSRRKKRQIFGKNTSK
jgi:hypothetical protein